MQPALLVPSQTEIQMGRGKIRSQPRDGFEFANFVFQAVFPSSLEAGVDVLENRRVHGRGLPGQRNLGRHHRGQTGRQDPPRGSEIHHHLPRLRQSRLALAAFVLLLMIAPRMRSSVGWGFGASRTGAAN